MELSPVDSPHLFKGRVVMDGWGGRAGGGKYRPPACPETCGGWEGSVLTMGHNKRVQGKGEAKLIRREMFKSTAEGTRVSTVPFMFFL